MRSPVPACSSSDAPNPLGSQEGTRSQLCPVGWFSQWFLLWDGSVLGKKGLCCEEPTASPSPRTRPRWVLGLHCCRKCFIAISCVGRGAWRCWGLCSVLSSPTAPLPPRCRRAGGSTYGCPCCRDLLFHFSLFPCSFQALCQRSCRSKHVTEHILQVLPRGDTG